MTLNRPSHLLAALLACLAAALLSGCEPANNAKPLAPVEIDARTTCDLDGMLLADYAGPLAGFLTGLERCETSWLLTVPCDTPLFPLDLAARLAAAADAQGADIAMAAAPEDDGTGRTTVRTQPVFCLLRVDLLESLVAFTQAGGRKIDAWTGQHHCAIVPFDAPGDDPKAFFNANTLAELHALESASAPQA